MSILLVKNNFKSAILKSSLNHLYQELINDIEKGKVSTIITKDLSRLGRDYLKTGYYLENYFP